jgi:hypothetical protein
MMRLLTDADPQLADSVVMKGWATTMNELGIM